MIFFTNDDFFGISGHPFGTGRDKSPSRPAGAVLGPCGPCVGTGRKVVGAQNTKILIAVLLRILKLEAQKIQLIKMLLLQF